MMMWAVKLGWCSATQLLVWHPCALLSPAALCKCRIYTQNTFNAHMEWVCVCAEQELGVRALLGLPMCVFCTSASIALSWTSPVSLLPTGSLLLCQGPLTLGEVAWCCRGFHSRGSVPFPVAPGKPGSAQCQSCWPGWLLREKLSTKLLTVFSEVLWLCVNILFLHFYNLQWFCSIAVIDS